MELDHAISSLQSWMAATPQPTPLGMLPATSEVLPIPFGVSLVIGPFNYPIGNVLSPMISAVAAGNCCVIRPSEMTPNCEKVLYDLIPKYLDTKCIGLVCGGIETATFVLKQKFDKIFFTGSTRVGKIIMTAAAQHLTPVTLELGK